MISNFFDKSTLKLKSIFKYVKLNINSLILTFKKYFKIFVTSTLLKRFVKFFMLFFFNLIVIISLFKYYPSIIINKLNLVLNEEEYSNLIDEIFKQCPDKNLLIKSLKNYYYYQHLINLRSELFLILFAGICLGYFSTYLLNVTNFIDHDWVYYCLIKLPDFETFVSQFSIDFDKNYVEEEYLSEFVYVFLTNKKEEEDFLLIFKLLTILKIWFPIFMSHCEYTINKAILEMEYVNMIGLDDFFYILT